MPSMPSSVVKRTMSQFLLALRCWDENMLVFSPVIFMVHSRRCRLVSSRIAVLRHDDVIMLGAVLIPLRRHRFEYREIRTSQPGRQKVYPRRSQQPGAGVGRCRGRAPLHNAGGRTSRLGRRRQSLRRLLGLLGPLILGHAHRGVLADIVEAAGNGTSFGAPTEYENALARRVVEAFPSMDMVRFVSSGTEAAMSALRLARAYTGRDKIIKFQGGYHGHADALLVAAGSGAMAHGVPDSAGVTASFAQDTLIAEYTTSPRSRST